MVPGTHCGLPLGLSRSFVRVYEAAWPRLMCRVNDLHTCLSCQFVVELLEQEGGMAEVVVPAILLHDIGWHAVRPELVAGAFGPHSTDSASNRQHEVQGAQMARDVLDSLDYPSPLTGEICRIIDRHDSGVGAASPEEAIVKDADKLSRFCQLGFPFTLLHLKPSTPQEVHDWLASSIHEWMLTRTGFELATANIEARRQGYGLQPAKARMVELTRCSAEGRPASRPLSPSKSWSRRTRP